MTAVADVPLDQQLNTLPHSAISTSALVLDGDSLDRMMRLADIMAGGKATIPKHLAGNSADCLAVVMQAMQWGMNPFAVAQKTHMTQGGTLGYEAQLVNAVVIANAPVVGRPEYEFLGEWDKILGKVKEMTGNGGGKYYAADWKKDDEAGLGIIVRLTLKGEDAPREVKVMMSQAYPRFSTQWATDPQQQISYLAIRKWARRYTPDVILGVYTNDELEESPAMRDITPPSSAAAPQELPPYPDAQLEASSEQWREKIAAKKTSPDHLINTISSKYTLSDEQKDKIRALAPIEGEATNASA